MGYADPYNTHLFTLATANIDKLVKSQKLTNLSFPRKRESSNYKQLWIPDQVGNDKTAKTPTFCETVNIKMFTKNKSPISHFEKQSLR